MTHADNIASVEARLAEVGVSVSEVCRRARVDRATWHRWKRDGGRPRSSTWERVEKVLQDLQPEAVAGFTTPPGRVA